VSEKSTWNDNNDAANSQNGVPSLSFHRRRRHWRCKFARDRYNAVYSQFKSKFPIKGVEIMENGAEENKKHLRNV
jgi:hypothetical protein